MKYFAIYYYILGIILSLIMIYEEIKEHKVKNQKVTSTTILSIIMIVIFTPLIYPLMAIYMEYLNNKYGINK